MNKDKLYSSCSFPSISNESTAFITATPDDYSFVSSQIEKIDRRNYLSHFYSLKPWEKVGNVNSYLSSGKSNYMVLKELKDKRKNNKVDLKNIDWGSVECISKEKIDDILDANAILKRYKNKSKCKEEYIDIHTFASQNKEICMKNIIIDLMNNERYKISKTCDKREKGLLSFSEDLNNDKNYFESTRINLINKLKTIENKLYNVSNSNKILLEKKRKYAQENRILLEETEKTIRKILNMKTYCEFVSMVFQDKKTVFPTIAEDLSLVKNNNNKEKELQIFSNEIIHKFNFILNFNDLDIYLEDPINLLNVFNQLESKIINLLYQKEEFKEDYEKASFETNKVKSSYQVKIDELDSTISSLYNEKKKIEFDIINYKKVKNSIEVQNAIKYLKYIDKEINDVFDIDLKGLFLKFDINDSIYKINFIIKEIDKEVNFYINTLTKYESLNPRILENAVKDRKEINKITKHEKDMLAKIEEEKTRQIAIENKFNSLLLFSRHKYPENPLPPVKVKKINNNNINNIILDHKNIIIEEDQYDI